MHLLNTLAPGLKVPDMLSCMKQVMLHTAQSPAAAWHYCTLHKSQVQQTVSAILVHSIRSDFTDEAHLLLHLLLLHPVNDMM